MQSQIQQETEFTKRKEGNGRQEVQPKRGFLSTFKRKILGKEYTVVVEPMHTPNIHSSSNFSGTYSDPATAAVLSPGAAAVQVDLINRFRIR